MKSAKLVTIIIAVALVAVVGFSLFQNKHYNQQRAEGRLPVTNERNSESGVQVFNLIDYKTNGTFGFSYADKVCNTETNECYKTYLIKDQSTIKIIDEQGSGFTIYYSEGIKDVDSIDTFLKQALKNDLCKIDKSESRSTNEMGVVGLFLDSGCSLYGPDYEKYSFNHPEAIGLTGKTRAYWSKETGELVVYAVGQGGGCAFTDCVYEENLVKTFKLNNVGLY